MTDKNKDPFHSSDAEEMWRGLNGQPSRRLGGSLYHKQYSHMHQQIQKNSHKKPGEFGEYDAVGEFIILLIVGAYRLSKYLIKGIKNVAVKFLKPSVLIKTALIAPIIATVGVMNMDGYKRRGMVIEITDLFNRTSSTITNRLGYTAQHTHYVVRNDTRVRPVGELDIYAPKRYLMQGSCVSVIGVRSYDLAIQVPNEYNRGGVSHYYTLRENLAPLPAGYECPNTVDRLQLSGNFNGQVTGDVRHASVERTIVSAQTPRTLIR